MKIVKRACIGVLALAIAGTITHRLCLQLRPLPINSCVNRPMTQAEWDLRFGTNTNTPMPAHCSMVDEFPYPPVNETPSVSASDLRKIRALASWAAWMPFRTTRIQVWNSTNVSLLTYERHTSKLEFTKEASGWHMERVGGIMDWISEDAEPTFSFH
jgi:hypothetical protein